MKSWACLVELQMAFSSLVEKKSFTNGDLLNLTRVAFRQRTARALLKPVVQSVLISVLGWLLNWPSSAQTFTFRFDIFSGSSLFRFTDIGVDTEVRASTFSH